MQVEAFFDDSPTSALTYPTYDAISGDTIVIDPVLDLDTVPWRTITDSIDKLARWVADRRPKVRWILDTRVHADHLSGAHELPRRLQVKAAIGSHIAVVQEIFKEAFNLLDDFPTDGRQFDRLLGDGDVLSIPDVSVARCGFPRGSARDLCRPVTERLDTLPDDMRIYVGHDYPDGRGMRFQTTIGESKHGNTDLPAAISDDAFVDRIEARDRDLSAPRLRFPSLQVNINAGRLPAAEGNGAHYLKIPLNCL